MVRAGLIFAVIMLVLNGLVYVPRLGWVACCISILGLAAGIVSGLQAGRFDRPASASLAARTGAGAGAISGLGALLANVMGSLLTAYFVGPEGAAENLRYIGWPADPAQNPLIFFAGAGGIGVCVGLIVLVILAGLGALGGLLWYQTAGKRAVVIPPPAM